MQYLLVSLDFYTILLLILALVFVLLYEVINGFHDTANAVATVIYTRAMQAKFAVATAGIFNFCGVMLGGLSVTYAIVHLLPTDLILNVVNSAYGLIMIFSMLLAAIIWNLGTWYLRLPASSSHTLIGAIIGVGLTNALINKSSIVDALNISKVIGVFLSLIISPIIGFIIAGLLIFFFRYYCNCKYFKCNKKHQISNLSPSLIRSAIGFENTDLKKETPPFWIRTALILSAVGVSFAHGANDGQKGIGLIMLVLISVAPAGFVLNMNANSYDITRTYDAIIHLQQYYEKNKAKAIEIDNHIINNNINILHKEMDDRFHCDILHLNKIVKQTLIMLTNIQSYSSLYPEQRNQMRCLLMCLSEIALDLAKLPSTIPDEASFLLKLSKDLLNTVEYAPLWITISVALALSIGTMIGWRRITITIGEKIGKKGMTYVQGVFAQITAAIYIGIASYTGMPVSTTQVLSSTIAGTMIIDGGGIQTKTIKNILLVWLFTLPISVVLSGLFYWILLQLM